MRHHIDSLGTITKPTYIQFAHLYSYLLRDSTYLSYWLKSSGVICPAITTSIWMTKSAYYSCLFLKGMDYCLGFAD